MALPVARSGAEGILPSPQTSAISGPFTMHTMRSMIHSCTTLLSVLALAGTTLAVKPLVASPTRDPNMNGDTYMLQATPHGQAALANWSTRFSE